MDDLERRLAKAEGDISELFRELRGTTTALAKLEVTSENILMAVGELKEAVKGLQQRPGSMWDKVMTALISAFVAAAIAFFVGGGR